MKLVINAGSSSLKVALYEKEKLLQHYHYDLSVQKLVHKGKAKKPVKSDVIDVAHALRDCVEKIREEVSLQKVDSIIHRVVHGGEFYSKTTLITSAVKEKISALRVLAPLHNPPALQCIVKAEMLFPNVKQFAIFDTAYHQTIPSFAYRYGLPEEMYSKLKIRKYGFHGTSHKYLAQEATSITKAKKIITCHLGSGSSICANLNGVSVDTTMGFTPTDGLIMGTRSGALDPEVALYLLKFLKRPETVEKVLTKQSGLLGVSGISSDVRKLWQERKNPKAKLALQMLSYQIKKYISSYNGVLNGVDCIVFSGGVGENAWYVRKDALEGLEHLGIKVDLKKNKLAIGKNKPMMIHSKSSKVKILVILANEELQMIREVK